MRHFFFILLFLVSFPFFGQSGENATNGKTRIAVIDFSSKGEIADSPYLAEAIVEHLITALIDSNEYAVVERSRLRDIMKELELQDSDDFNDNVRLKIGELYNAEIIVLGSLTKIGERYTINVRGVNVETGVAIFAKNLDTYSKETLVDLVPRIVALITGQATEEDVTKELKDIQKRKKREEREKRRQEKAARKQKSIQTSVDYKRIFQINLSLCAALGTGCSIAALIGWLGYFFPSMFLLSTTFDFTTPQEEKVAQQETLKARMYNVAIAFTVLTGVFVVGVITFAILSAINFNQKRVHLNNSSPMISLNDKLSMWLDVKAGYKTVGAEVKFSF